MTATRPAPALALDLTAPATGDHTGHAPCGTHSGSQRLSVFVPGIPRPQGSKRAIVNKKTKKAALIESSTGVKTWREDIRAELADHGQPILDGPVSVAITFVMPRPRSHYRTGRNAHLLRDAAPTRPTGKPDIDKLSRAVLDAIGGRGLNVWRDDSQVTDLTAVKRYARRDEQPGAWITIEPMQETIA